jgi:hypothetical protein
VTSESDASTPALYPIQLEDVLCATVRGERRGLVEGDPARGEQGTRVELSFTGLDDERTRFRCRLDVSVIAPVLDDEVADLSIVVQGNYVAETPIEEDEHAAFVQFTPIIQLWPYARGYVSDLGRLLGVNLPPLPVVDVARPSLPPGLAEIGDTESQE